jgi:hypothetical protein
MTPTKRAQPEPTDDRMTARQAAALAADRARIAAKHAATNPDEPVFDAESHQATISDRLAQLAPDVDMYDMRDMTGIWIVPDDELTAMRHSADRSPENGGMMGDRD